MGKWGGLFVLVFCFLTGATNVGGSESGSSNRARGKIINLQSVGEVQEEDVSVGHELLNLPVPSSVVSLDFTLVWYRIRPQKSTATVAQVPKESLSYLTCFLSLLASLFLFFCLAFT